MTKTKEALEALNRLKKSMLSDGYDEESIAIEWIETIRAALTNAPEVVTVEDITMCIQEWKFDEYNKHVFFGDYLRVKFPDGIKIVSEK